MHMGKTVYMERIMTLMLRCNKKSLSQEQLSHTFTFLNVSAGIVTSCLHRVRVHLERRVMRHLISLLKSHLSRKITTDISTVVSYTYQAKGEGHSLGVQQGLVGQVNQLHPTEGENNININILNGWWSAGISSSPPVTPWKRMDGMDAGCCTS